MIIVQIADPTRSVQVGRQIDALFTNSPAETRTQSEQEEAEAGIQRFGDFYFFTNAICGAVFFALLFITANTMIQSGRERVLELAVLKTLGFSNSGVLAIILAEATLLCGVAAIIGLGIAAVLFPQLKNFIGLQHFHWQERSMHRLLNLIAYFIGSVMAIGALFGALNTMYSAVADRSTEIATLRALGFVPGAVATAVVLEALLLALLGAGAGVMLAYSLFDGSAVNTISGAIGGSQVVYQLAVTRELVVTGVIVASAVGLAGGLLPAVRAAQIPIVSALRAN